MWCVAFALASGFAGLCAGFWMGKEDTYIKVVDLQTEQLLALAPRANRCDRTTDQEGKP